MRLSTDKLMLVGLVALTLAEALTHYGQVYPDSPGYILTEHFFQGRATVAQVNFRLLRPVIPLLASLANYVVSPRASFAIVNMVLWCAAAILVFYFTKLLTENVYSALFSALVFTTAIPLLLFGDAVLTDMGGYAFILLCIYLVIKWNIPRATIGRVFLMALVLGLGILVRESVASALIFAVAWTLWSTKSVTRAAILLLIPLAISLAWSYTVGISYAAWYTQGGVVYAATNQPLTPLHRLLRLAGNLQYTFGRYPEILLLAALGLWAKHDKATLRVHISIWIGAFAVILAWPVIDTRFTFILFPSVFPLAGLGLEEAYRILFRSDFAGKIWPRLADSEKLHYIFLLLVVAVYALITNYVLRHYVSLPWMPYTDPSVKLTDLT